MKIAGHEAHVPKNWIRCKVTEVQPTGKVATVHPCDLLTGQIDENRPLVVSYERKGVVLAREEGLYLQRDYEDKGKLKCDDILVVAPDDRDQDHVAVWGWAYINEYRWALDQWDEHFNPHRVIRPSESLRPVWHDLRISTTGPTRRNGESRRQFYSRDRRLAMVS